MTYTCPICKKVSADVKGYEVWAIECGHVEISLPNRGITSSGWSACGKPCAAKLLSELMRGRMEIKPHGTPSKTWKCETCGKVLPAHVYQDPRAQVESVPNTAPMVKLPNDDAYHCFCSNACMLNFLRDESITKTE